MQPMERLNLALRGTMEFGVVAGFAFWGASRGASTGAHLLFGVLVPVIGFGVWGAIDFRWAGRAAEPLRLTEELLLSGLAAAAFWASGHALLGATLAALSVVHHIMVYLLGGRLLR